MLNKQEKYSMFFNFFSKYQLSFLLVQSTITLLKYGCRPSVTASYIPGQMGNQAAQWSNVGYFGNLQPPFSLTLQNSIQRVHA